MNRGNYIVNPDNIARIAIQTMHDLGQGQFDSMEAVMGLVEAVGRIIVDTAPTPVQAKEMLAVSMEHLHNVITAGFETKGFRQ